MKIGEILRQLADYVDAQEAEQHPGGYPGDHQEPANPPELDAQAGTGESPDEVYVGPLQQKHELLKKATGVENNVDKFAADDELAKMQANAGIQPTTVINQTIEVNPNGQQTQTVQSAVPSPTAAITMPALGDHNDID